MVTNPVTVDLGQRADRGGTDQGTGIGQQVEQCVEYTVPSDIANRRHRLHPQDRIGFRRQDEGQKRGRGRRVTNAAEGANRFHCNRLIRARDKGQERRNSRAVLQPAEPLRGECARVADARPS